MYITVDEYIALYDPVDRGTFNRLSFDACRYIDRHTTGIDGVKKLQKAFPVDEYSKTAVKHCAAAIVNFLIQIDAAEKNAAATRGYTETGNGFQGKVVSSVSAGNESISYSSGDAKTAVELALADTSAKNKVISDIVYDYLSGITDANGVNLLYMGSYPG